MYLIRSIKYFIYIYIHLRNYLEILFNIKQFFSDIATADQPVSLRNMNYFLFGIHNGPIEIVCVIKTVSYTETVVQIHHFIIKQSKKRIMKCIAAPT